ncbi:hypothetical protein EIP91_009043 [Steccherinum ochraceum]|uniref:Uncharacterized protein n=1 Tax=Steccherinum ochraceum TaxID=92696 RepID=A0A4R0R254_9APHY|nr:hypothetical protein EIP91_009043 [Steccherinum ochraceum]
MSENISPVQSSSYTAMERYDGFDDQDGTYVLPLLPFPQQLGSFARYDDWENWSPKRSDSGDTTAIQTPLQDITNREDNMPGPSASQQPLQSPPLQDEFSGQNEDEVEGQSSGLQITLAQLNQIDDEAEGNHSGSTDSFSPRGGFTTDWFDEEDEDVFDGPDFGRTGGVEQDSSALESAAAGNLISNDRDEDEDECRSNLTSSDSEDDDDDSSSAYSSDSENDEPHRNGLHFDGELATGPHRRASTPSLLTAGDMSTQSSSSSSSSTVNDTSTQLSPPSLSSERRVTRSRGRAQSHPAEGLLEVSGSIATSSRKRKAEDLATAEEDAEASAPILDDSQAELEKRFKTACKANNIPPPLPPNEAEFKKARTAGYKHTISGVCCIGASVEGQGKNMTMKTEGCGAIGLESQLAAIIHLMLYHGHSIQRGKPCPWPGCEMTFGHRSDSKPFRHIVRHLCKMFCPVCPAELQVEFATEQSLDGHLWKSHKDVLESNTFLGLLNTDQIEARKKLNSKQRVEGWKLMNGDVVWAPVPTEKKIKEIIQHTAISDAEQSSKPEVGVGSDEEERPTKKLRKD